MELGNQIRQLRLRRGITQEALAEKLGVSAQAVSKWERGTAAPDIGLLPELSACFGVSIDSLFSLSDETRMERIQNMLWDERNLNPGDVAAAREFLLEKARREPGNGRPHELLADLENHLALEHRRLAEEAAKEALARDPSLRGAFSELVQAMQGACPDWNARNHNRLIDYLKDFIDAHPDCLRAYLWLLDQLLDDFRFDEAEVYTEKMARLDGGWRGPMYRGEIAWYRGDREKAEEIWAQMEKDYPDSWQVSITLGDFHAQSLEFARAKADFRRALEGMEKPRFVDPLICIAQVCQMEGDLPGAIAALEEELSILDKEWNCTTGETADVVRREIAGLREKLAKAK